MCGCRKNSGAGTIAPSGTSVPLGLLPHMPFIIGDDGVEFELMRVQVALPVEGLVTGQAAWVKGSGAQGLVDSGHLVRIDIPRAPAQMWRVGQFTYTDYEQALAVAQATGQSVEAI